MTKRGGGAKYINEMTRGFHSLVLERRVHICYWNGTFALNKGVQTILG